MNFTDEDDIRIRLFCNFCILRQFSECQLIFTNAPVLPFEEPVFNFGLCNWMQIVHVVRKSCRINLAYYNVTGNTAYVIRYLSWL